MINSIRTTYMGGYFFFCFLLFGLMTFGQGESSIWYFGLNAGVDFNGGFPKGITDGQLRTNEGCSTICNKKGEILFYTDGITVWDKTHRKMPNGFGLMGDPSSTQSAIIVPKPNSESIYYIFTVSNEGRAEGFRYSEVDITLNNGGGDVTSNKNLLLATPCAEKISAVQHANGLDFWVVTHSWNSADFLVFKVTENGVVSTPIKTTIGSVHGGTALNAIGYMKFSPNGKKLGVAKWNINSVVEIYDFDSRNGSITNEITIDNVFGSNTSDGAYGLEFSPDSNLLYVSDLNLNTYSSVLHQFNLSPYNKSSILNSDTILYQGRSILAAIQLAVDSKIYISNTVSSYLDVIHNPNNLGNSCNYQSKGLSLNGRVSVYGLPPFIQSFFVAKIKTEDVCFGEESVFKIDSDEQIDSVVWDFGDGTTSTDKNATHIYNFPGNYNVKAKVNSGYNVLNIEEYVEIKALPKVGVISNFEVCDDLSRDGKEYINLNQFDNTVLDGQSNKDFLVSYFVSQNDADLNKDALPSNFQNIDNPQQIYTRVQNLVTGCFNTGTFNYVVNNPMIASQPENIDLCDDEVNDGVEVFDLAFVENQIKNGLNGLISFYKSFEDAQTGENSIPKNYVNETNPQKIFARFESLSNRGCFDITSFYIEVKELPIIQMNAIWYLCSGEATTIFLDSSHDRYLWSTGETTPQIVVNQGGNYEVTVYKDYESVYKTACSVTKTIEVIESAMPESLDIVVEDWTSNSNSITINATGIGNYEYSMDDVYYQDTNAFNNLKTGDYMVYVRDKNGCGTLSQEVFLLNYPKFFTPNGDGYNDFWKIQFSESEPDITVRIFDRYGKLMNQFSSLSRGWDGNLNGYPLPVSDYWFVVDRPSKDKQYKGHFTLKR